MAACQALHRHTDAPRQRDITQPSISWREDPYGFVTVVHAAAIPAWAVHANLWFMHGRWVLCNVWVHPRYRGQGLMHRVMAALATWQRLYHVPAVWFTIAGSNMPFWSRMALEYPLTVVGRDVRIGVA